MPELRWIAGTCPPPDGWNEMRRRTSDGLNSCPAVFELGDEVVMQGDLLDEENRRKLNIPDGENAVRIPKSVYLRGAELLSERHE